MKYLKSFLVTTALAMLSLVGFVLLMAVLVWLCSNHIGCVVFAVAILVFTALWFYIHTWLDLD